MVIFIKTARSLVKELCKNGTLLLCCYTVTQYHFYTVLFFSCEQSLDRGCSLRGLFTFWEHHFQFGWSSRKTAVIQFSSIIESIIYFMQKLIKSDFARTKHNLLQQVTTTVDVNWLSCDVGFTKILFTATIKSSHCEL